MTGALFIQSLEGLNDEIHERMMKVPSLIRSFVTIKEESKLEHRKGPKELLIPEAVNDRKIVAMCRTGDDRLFIATERGVYEKVGEILCRVRFEDETVEELPISDNLPIDSDNIPWEVNDFTVIPANAYDLVEVQDSAGMVSRGRSIDIRWSQVVKYKILRS